MKSNNRGSIAFIVPLFFGICIGGLIAWLISLNLRDSLRKSLSTDFRYHESVYRQTLTELQTELQSSKTQIFELESKVGLVPTVKEVSLDRKSDVSLFSEISRLHNELEECKNHPAISTALVNRINDVSPDNSANSMYRSSSKFEMSLNEPKTSREASCDLQYGYEHLMKWKFSEEEWCSANSGSSIQSSISCYSNKLPHRVRKGINSDAFCELRNVFVDFSKISGSIQSGGLSMRGNLLKFDSGALRMECTKTGNYNIGEVTEKGRKLMESLVLSRPPEKYQTEDKTTYVLQRDEDAENTFHSTADFMNMYSVYQILSIDPSESSVLVLDGKPDGPYWELIEKAYSRRKPPSRHTDFSKQVVLFNRLVLHMESPTGIIFPGMEDGRVPCKSGAVFDGYRRHILDSFGLLNQPHPPVPYVTLVVRKRLNEKNVGRIIANENEVVKYLESISLSRLMVVDTAKLTFREQLNIMRSTSVLVGVHGAGLMHILFTAEESVLVEIHPHYRMDRHFRHAAKLSGKIYMPMRSMIPVTCEGTSDNVIVDMEEFQKTMDGALRLARSFSNGLIECGAKCDPKIMSLDDALIPYYLSTDAKVSKPPMNFPCG